MNEKDEDLQSFDNQNDENLNQKHSNSINQPLISNISPNSDLTTSCEPNNEFEQLSDDLLDIFDAFDPNLIESEVEYVLILQIHGIQSNLKSQSSIFKTQQTTINTMMSDFFPKSKYRQDIRFCYWKGYAIKVLGDLLKKTNPSEDQFFKQVGMELLFYDSNPKAADMICNQIVAQMNNAYLECRKKFGHKFKGKVILHGHSLGSYLSQEILKRQKSTIYYSKDKQKYSPNHGRLRLLFDVEQFQSLGAVIGLFYSLKQEKLSMDQLGKVKKWFNVQQEKDPVATKVEPLMNEYIDNLQPAWVLPNPYKNKGREDSAKLKEFCDVVYRNFDTNQNARINDQFMNKVKLDKFGGKEEHTQESVGCGTTIQLDRHFNRKNWKRKFDFQLQDSISSQLIKPMAQFGNHFGYWSNVDFFQFMHSNLEGQPITDVSQKNNGMIIKGVWYEI